LLQYLQVISDLGVKEVVVRAAALYLYEQSQVWSNSQLINVLVCHKDCNSS
jgi:hypothetical protein